MTIATKVNYFLEKNDIHYRSIRHYHSAGSISSALAADISTKQMAKAVILEDHDGHKMMAVLPADKKVSFSVINEKFNAKYHLISETDVHRMFSDCEAGAVPPVGGAYNIRVICDQLLDILDEVYIEAGDHQTLLQLDKPAFKSLMSGAKHMRFGKESYH
ncbi:aminoacyl-tRNA deacylase [Vibrio paucivorans]